MEMSKRIRREQRNGDPQGPVSTGGPDAITRVPSRYLLSAVLWDMSTLWILKRIPLLDCRRCYLSCLTYYHHKSSHALLSTEPHN